MLVSDETYFVQKTIYEIFDQINETQERKTRLLCHDPLVGFHEGVFTLDGMCNPSQALNDLIAVISGEGMVDPVAIAPEEDVVLILKGWENLWREEDKSAPEVCQAFSNIIQGNLCSPIRDEEKVYRGRRMIIMISKSPYVPQSLPEIKPVDVPLPDVSEFKAMVERFWTSFGEAETPVEFKDLVAKTLVGFSRIEAEDALSLSLVQHGGKEDYRIVEVIEDYKAASVRSVPGLTYKKKQFTENQTNFLPGYEPLRDYIQESMGLDEELAKKHKIRPFRGYIVVGPPGTGKSVISGESSKLLGVPQLEWSLGESQGSLVSESERNTRRVINVAKALKAQLTLDDADKAGISTGGSAANDGGVFDRMINILLTEMAQEDCPITWVITANRVQNLRPELYRDGRIDGHFFVDLPDEAMRVQILRYHIKKHNFPTDRFYFNGLLSEKASTESLLDITSDKYLSGWSGAELATLVERACRKAIKAREEYIDLAFMKEAASKKTPQSKQAAHRKDYEEMRALCSDFVVLGKSSSQSSSIEAETRLNKKAVQQIRDLR